MNVVVALMMVLMVASNGTRGEDDAISGAFENRPSVIASIIAANRCLRKFRNTLGKHAEGEPSEDLVCDIPLNLSESDLDELIRVAVKSATMGDNVKSFAEKYSSTIAKKLTSFHGAECEMRLRVAREAIVAARKADTTEMVLDDQTADCEVLTGGKSRQKLSFAFSPRIRWEKGCVADFQLNMGKIDAGCEVCYLNRLYLATSAVAAWANRLAPRTAEVLNRHLGGECW